MKWEMNKKTWFGIVFLIGILLVPFTSAQTPPNNNDVISYWKMETGVDAVGTFDLTVDGATSGATGIINNAYSYDGVNDYLYTNSDVDNVKTWSFWIYLDDTSGNKRIINKDYTDGSTRDYYIEVNGNSLSVQLHNGATFVGNIFSGVLSATTWHHVVIVKESSNVQVYLDNSALTPFGGSFTQKNSNNKFQVGMRNSGTAFNPFEGEIDELSIYNASLNSSHVAYLYNSGSPGTSQQYPFSSSTSYFEIYGEDVEGGSVNNFSATVNGTNYITTNGTIITSIDKSLGFTGNVVIFNATNDEGSLFNKTYSSYNTSNDLTTSLHQVEVYLNATEIITDNDLVGTFYWDLQSNATTLWLMAGNQNITFEKTGYYNKTQEFSFTALENTTKNITGVYSSIINLTATNKTGGETINNLNGWVYNQNYSFNETYNTTGSYYEIPALKDSQYYIYLTSTNYTTNRVENYKTTTPTTNYEALGFSLYRDKSFLITVRDVITNSLLTNITLYLYGSTTYNYTFDNSTFRFGLNPQTYDLSIQKSGYGEYTGTIPITNGGLYNNTFYLTQSPTDIKIYIKNIYDQYLSSATAQVIRASDGVILSEDTSDFAGEVEFSLLRGRNYYLNITKEGYEDFYESFNALDTEYTITLLQDTTETRTYYGGFNYSFYPTPGTVLANNTNYTFQFRYNNGGEWGVLNCSITLIGYYNQTTYSLGANNTGSCSNTTGTITITNNTQVYDTIIAYGSLTLDDSAIISYKSTYSISNFYEGTHSLKNALNSLKGFNKAGWTTFETSFLVFIIILSIWGVTQMSKNAIEKKYTVSTILLFVLILLANYLGFLQITFLGNTPGGKWGMSIIAGCMALIAILTEKGVQ